MRKFWTRDVQCLAIEYISIYIYISQWITELWSRNIIQVQDDCTWSSLKGQHLKNYSIWASVPQALVVRGDFCPPGKKMHSDQTGTIQQVIAMVASATCHVKVILTVPTSLLDLLSRSRHGGSFSRSCWCVCKWTTAPDRLVNCRAAFSAAEVHHWIYSGNQASSTRIGARSSTWEWCVN